MEFTNYSAFICVAAPMLLMIFMVEPKARANMAGIFVGLVLCLMASELNGILLNLFNQDYSYVTTSITPMVEETFKAIPVIYFAYLFSDKRETLLAFSFAVGVGFAIMENLALMIANPNSIAIEWAIARGLCTGLMHAICTAMIGMCLAKIRTVNKVRLLEFFAMLTLSITYHGVYNALVQSEHMYLGLLLPAVTYLGIFIVVRMRHRTPKEQGQEHVQNVSEVEG